MHDPHRNLRSRRPRPGRRFGFTVIEVLVATMITAFVVGSVTMSLSRLGRARSVSKERLDAHLRADAALNTLRRDIAAVVRTDDLFFTRVLIVDNAVNSPIGALDRDDLLLFSNRLRPIRNIDYSGEGIVYETQYRIETDEAGPVLWQRRDALPDEYPLGGGVASPQVEGIISVNYEAYDGEQWYEEWDSDDFGLPVAVRATVMASGHRDLDDVFDAPLAILRTVVSIDRVLIPSDIAALEDEPIEDEPAEEPGDEGEVEGGVDDAAGGGTGQAIETGGEATGGGGRGGDDRSPDRPSGRDSARQLETRGGGGSPR